MKLNLPLQVNMVIDRLNVAGYEAYVVGGCVRDFVMGRIPKDYDVTTSATPEQVKAVFEGSKAESEVCCKVIETGIKHGTVTVIADHMAIEVTTYRVEKGYSDGRHPDKVEFTKNLREDLSRRDFTINAMAYSHKAGLIDYFDGQRDIREKKIRTVGRPKERFTEDGLRILRGVRFASTLGFDIEEETAEAMKGARELLQRISQERIAVELGKLLCGDNVKKVLLENLDVIGQVVPELLPMGGFDQKNPHHIYDVLTHTAVAVENIEAKPYLRWAMLLHDVAKPETFAVDDMGVGHFYGHASQGAEMARVILRRLKMDNETISRVTCLVKYHDMQIETSAKAVRRVMNKLGEEGFFDLIKVKRADNMGQDMKHRSRQLYYDQLENLACEIIETKDCFSLKDLAVNGKDLIDAGVTEGSNIGEILTKMLDAVIDGGVENNKEILLKKFL